MNQEFVFVIVLTMTVQVSNFEIKGTINFFELERNMCLPESVSSQQNT